jgi:intein-encoded DNA endonuclease-like protein
MLFSTVFLSKNYVIRRVELNHLDLKGMGYLMSLYVGDGYSNYSKKDRHYRVDFYLDAKKDIDIIERLEEYLKRLKLNPYFVKCRGATRVSVNSKSFKEFVEDFDLRLSLKNRDFLLGFLSGFIDSDGYVAKGDIVITQKDKYILKVLSGSCEKQLGVSTRIWQRTSRFRSSFYAWNFRISTRFRFLAHISCKVERVYGGARACALRSEKQEIASCKG